MNAVNMSQTLMPYSNGILNARYDHRTDTVEGLNDAQQKARHFRNGLL
jgi:hypothetical protein